MRRVRAALELLHVVHVGIDAVHPHVLDGNVEEAPGRERRHLLGRAEIGPQEAARLARRIGLGLEPLAEVCIGAIRHVEDRAVDRELPAVIEAAQALVLVASERQRDAAVRTALFQEPQLAVAVLEGDQPLAQHLDPHGIAVRARQLLGQADGMPEASEHVAHPGSRPYPAQQLVVGLGQHGFLLLFVGAGIALSLLRSMNALTCRTFIK